jgi:hypothetical protein
MDDRSQRLPSAAEIAEINAKHLIQTPLKAADLLFLFGTRVEEVYAQRPHVDCGGKGCSAGRSSPAG